MTLKNTKLLNIFKRRVFCFRNLDIMIFPPRYFRILFGTAWGKVFLDTNIISVAYEYNSSSYREPRRFGVSFEYGFTFHFFN